MSPPKQKRARAKSALRSVKQRARYVTSSVLQACRSMNRQCVAFEAHVPNRNFSGYDGKGARIKVDHHGHEATPIPPPRVERLALVRRMLFLHITQTKG